MRSLFFWVLTLSLAAHAQPLEGPWVAREFSSEFTVNNPHLCVRADSLADLFICTNTSEGGQVSHSVFDLSRHELAVTPHDLMLTARAPHHIEDALTSGSEWFLLVTGLTSSTSGMTGGTLFRGRNQPAQQNVLFEDYWHGLGWYGGSMLVDCHLSERMGGGVIVSGLIIGAWGWEIDTWVWTVSVPAGSVTPVWAYSVWPGPFLNSDNVHGVSIEGDSVLAVYHAYQYNLAAISVLPIPLDSFPSGTSFPCPIRALRFARTDGGQLLCLSSGTPMQCLELWRDGSCEVRSEFSTELDFHAAAWHPQYGFAATFGSPSFLLLARIDTNGVSVHPLGVLHERDPEHVITESDVTITDDGRVVAAWLERTESQPSESRMMLASVGWDTYLEADDSHFILHPSSFILSTFPNPFNRALRIAYELPRAQEVELAVFNTLGQKVETLRAGWTDVGRHEATWRPSCAGGLYFVRLTAGHEIKTVKVQFVP